MKREQETELLIHSPWPCMALIVKLFPVLILAQDQNKT